MNKPAKAPVASPPRDPDLVALTEFYRRHEAMPTAMAPHMETLLAMAGECETVVEFGVMRGSSTAALLLGAERVISYDIVEHREAVRLREIAGGRWDFRVQSTLTAEPIPECDLLLVDSLHTYDQVKGELDRHAHRVKTWLVFHDVTTFGEVGASGESGRQSWRYEAGKGSVPRDHWGIRPAVDEFMIGHPEWRIAARTVESHGMLVLRKQETATC